MGEGGVRRKTAIGRGRDERKTAREMKGRGMGRKEGS